MKDNIYFEYLSCLLLVQDLTEIMDKHFVAYEGSLTDDTSLELTKKYDELNLRLLHLRNQILDSTSVFNGY